jgi:hypothetical protein
MIYSWDPIRNWVNFGFYAVIIALGYWIFTKSKNKAPLFIAIAFALLSVVYYFEVFPVILKRDLILIPMKILAYLAVIFALIKMVKK